jgi:hypothetical protein
MAEIEHIGTSLSGSAIWRNEGAFEPRKVMLWEGGDYTIHDEKFCLNRNNVSIHVFV